MFSQPLKGINRSIIYDYRLYRSFCVQNHCIEGRVRFDEFLRRFNKTFDTRFLCCGASPCQISTLPLQYLTYNDSDNYPATYGDIDYTEAFDNTEDFDYTELFDDNYPKLIDDNSAKKFHYDSNTASHSDSAEEFHSDSTKDIYNVSADNDAEVFDANLNIDKDPIDLANEFAKHFDSRSAVGVKSTFVHTRMGERTKQGHDMFNTSNIISSSPWLAAFMFLLCSLLFCFT